MYALSAADAISPAIQRTKRFLFEPFKWSTFLKLCLVALITENLGGNFQSGGHSGHTSSHGPAIYSPFHLLPGWIAVIVAATVGVIVLGFFVFYLVTRLRFAFFHCLIHNIREIRPGWRLYRTQATRFFRLNIVVGLCFLLVIVLIAVPFAAGFWRLFRETQAGGQLDVGLMLSLILPLIPIILLLVITAIGADLILRDLMLPHYALDNSAAGEAWAAAWTRIKAEKGTFFVYALLRVIVPLAAIIAVAIVMIIPAIIFAAVVAFAEIGIHSSFADATGGAAVAGILLQVLVGLVVFGVALFAGICIGGPLSTAIREWALLFYGGRYQKLGDILSPPQDLSLNAPGTA
jgi:hypothetical protein